MIELNEEGGVFFSGLGMVSIFGSSLLGRREGSLEFEFGVYMVEGVGEIVCGG